MRMRVYGALTAAAAILTTTVLSGTPAYSQDQNLSVTVQNVVAKVDRAGAISVSGTVNCAAAVAKAGPIPVQNYDVFVSVTWTASQAVGRKGRVTASWVGGGHAFSCYKSYNPTAFLPWNTSYYNSSSTDYFVTPVNGKFAKGPVAVDVTVTSFFDEGGNAFPNVYETDPATGSITAPTDFVVEVYGVTQFYPKAR